MCVKMAQVVKRMNTQISIFDGTTKFRFTKPIRLITLFSGYDSQALSLKYLGVPFEHYRTCEWAVQSIQALKDLHFGGDNTDYSATLSDLEIVDFLDGRISIDYNTPMTRAQIMRKGETWRRTVYNNMKASRNIGSIVKANADDLHIVDTNKYEYLLTYSFPCQDLSNAGKRAGMARGAGTRSGMLWEVERLLKESKELPQVLVMENVPEVVGQKNIKHFSEWVLFLDKLGYKSKWQILNGVDFAIPQNRKRCFMVSVLGDYYYDFPKKQGCKLRLKDLLENDVDEKYYLSSSIIEYYIKRNAEQKTKGNGFFFAPTNGDCIGKTILVKAGGRATDNYIAMGIGTNTTESFTKAPMVEKSRTLLANKSNCGGVIMAKTDKIYSVIKPKHGYFNGSVKQTDVSPTIDTGVDKWHTLIGESNVSHCECVVALPMGIRKLTEKECWRLMGVKDEDFEKGRKNQSMTSLYHLAGDSIITNCLMAIFKEML